MSLASNHFSTKQSMLKIEPPLRLKKSSVKNSTEKQSARQKSEKIKPEKLNSLMTHLGELSQSFIDSYEDLEGHVESLNQQLRREIDKKNQALQETQQLLNEKALISKHLQNLLALMPAGVVVIDAQGKVRECNAKAINFLGEPLNDQPWIEVIRRAFQPQDDDGHQVSLKDGRKIHIETRALDTEPGQLLLLTDLTKTRELQQEQSQKQKLASMGQMIASLAHQIRTPLSAAILYGSHLKENQIDDQLQEKFSGLLMERLSFIERQVNDMLNFIKGERKNKRQVLVNDFFDSLWCASQVFPNYVSFSFSQKQNSENFLMADQDALCAGILNLITNACEAVQDQQNPQVKISFMIDGNLTIAVSDNGVGIDSENIKKIFEPFYTSKKQGNGLGLAILHGLIIEHDGKIQVESKTGDGSCFTISLPLSRQLPISDMQNSAAQNSHIKSTELTDKEKSDVL